MTAAICILCGSRKHGAFTRCRDCDFQPATGYEFGLSMIYSDQILNQDHLSMLSQDTSRRFAADEYITPKLDKNAHDFILKNIQNSEYRDMFTLQRKARDSFLWKEMNWHTLGLDGPVSSIVRRGKDLDRKEFDVFRSELGMDAFFIEAYESAKRISHQVPRDIWYCLYDLYIYEQRKSHPLSRVLAGLNRESGATARHYLRTRHGIEET